MSHFFSQPHRRKQSRRKQPRALFLPPPTLHARYWLDSPSVGAGGAARVYPAWDTVQGKQVVLKRAHLSQKHQDTLCAEAEILSGLHHPAIPTYIEYFEEEGRAYLVETRMEGTPMEHLRNFTFTHVLWIGQLRCDMLDYRHRHQVVHRDISPANILLRMEKQTLALLDFGLARQLPSITHGNALPLGVERPAGTPGYVSPEQWNDGVVSTACDIYSLGMVLLCALTDCSPQEIVSVRSSFDLWENPATIPEEEIPLLELLDRMIAADATVRPHLTEIQFCFSYLSRQALGAD